MKKKKTALFPKGATAVLVMLLVALAVFSGCSNTANQAGDAAQTASQEASAGQSAEAQESDTSQEAGKEQSAESQTSDTAQEASSTEEEPPAEPEKEKTPRAVLPRTYYHGTLTRHKFETPHYYGVAEAGYTEEEIEELEPERDEDVIVNGTYDLFSFEEDALTAFPALEQVAERLNTYTERGIRAGVLSNMNEARNDYSTERCFEWAVTRADDAVFSVVLRNHAWHAAGGNPDDRYGFVFDPETGEELSYFDVVTDADGLAEALLTICGQDEELQQWFDDTHILLTDGDYQEDGINGENWMRRIRTGDIEWGMDEDHFRIYFSYSDGGPWLGEDVSWFEIPFDDYAELFAEVFSALPKETAPPVEQRFSYASLSRTERLISEAEEEAAKDALKKYASFLESEQKNGKLPEDARFAVSYIDTDLLPELVVYYRDGRNPVSKVYRVSDGKVKSAGNFDYYDGVLFAPMQGVIATGITVNGMAEIKTVLLEAGKDPAEQETLLGKEAEIEAESVLLLRERKLTERIPYTYFTRLSEAEDLYKELLEFDFYNKGA